MPPPDFAALAPLPRRFYNRDVATVARALLGKVVIRDGPPGLVAGRIVETEAYLADDDPASHSHRGPTRRNAAMFGPPGRAYVYAIHAKWCFNTVTEPAGRGSGVLVRALEPLAGVDLMRQRRGRDGPRELTRGPARLCQALAIDRQLNQWDLTLGEVLWIAGDGQHPPPPAQVAVTPRIGITRAADLPLRFALRDCPFVSGRRIPAASPPPP